MPELPQGQERFPCPRCGEGALPQARVCPHCGGALLFVVEVAATLPPREAYAAARELSEPPFDLTFLAAKHVLDRGGRLLAGATLSLAQAVATVVSSHQGRASVVLAEPATAERTATARPGRTRSALPWVAAAALATLLVAWSLRSPEVDEGPATAPARASLAVPARAAPPATLPATEIARLATRSTAALRCGASTGSGFFVRGDLLVTNAHVLCGQHEPLRVLLADGRELSGMPERSDDRLDLALVQVAGAAMPPLPLGDAAALRQGETVYFYGSPRGLDFTLGQALVSHAARAWRGVAYVQIDGNVNPGNSGGPLLDTQGRVVGVVTLRGGDSSGLGLALPVNYLYLGAEPLLSPPPGRDPQAWSRLLQRVAEEDEREVAEVRAQLARTALAGAFLTRSGEVVALVARRADNAPAAAPLELRLERDGSILCWPQGTADRWQRLEELEDEVDDVTREWLQRHAVGFQLWAASVPLDWSRCPPPETVLGSELVLPAGNGRADRTRLSPSPSLF